MSGHICPNEKLSFRLPIFGLACEHRYFAAVVFWADNAIWILLHEERHPVFTQNVYFSTIPNKMVQRRRNRCNTRTPEALRIAHTHTHTSQHVAIMSGHICPNEKLSFRLPIFGLACELKLLRGCLCGAWFLSPTNPSRIQYVDRQTTMVELVLLSIGFLAKNHAFPISSTAAFCCEEPIRNII